ncbi:nitrous oxide reductase accessory protein NosL [bacterium]|nr:nitrous oxide reductase accessory protein NosL [bacterium]
MRYLLTSVLCIVVAVASAWAAEQEPRCDQCGMFIANSPTHVTASITSGDKEYAHQFESLGCYLNYLAENYDKEAEVTELAILDFNSFGTDVPAVLAASDASYLYGTKRLKGSMAPFIAAFADEEAAKAAQGELGGELVDYAGMLQQLSEDSGVDCQVNGLCAGCAAPQPKDADGDATYICPCTGGCCDNISSDKPGECPQCGMQLVKSS